MEAGDNRNLDSDEHPINEVEYHMIRMVDDFEWVWRSARNNNLKFGHQKGQHHGRKGC